MAARVLIALVLIGLWGCERIDDTDSTIKIGAAFPNLPLISLEGRAAKLDEFRGKLLILNVWATWCGPCRKELPSLDSLAKLLGNEQFAVVGLSIDEDKLLVREYLSDKDIHLPIYFTADGELDYTALGIKVFPYTFIIKPDGTLLDRQAGEKVWNTAQQVSELRRLVE